MALESSALGVELTSLRWRESAVGLGAGSLNGDARVCVEIGTNRNDEAALAGSP
jgi:hypothetical protein